MTILNLIEEIIKKNPEISQEQIQERLKAEKIRTSGLFSDETLLRLIAAKFGIQIRQNHIQNDGILQTSSLVAGLNDVSVEGLLIAVFPAKTFQGIEKSGKFATIVLMDREGILRVVLWDSKAELVECGELKAGQSVRLIHGYTKQDRNGKTELHLGSKSQIEIEPEIRDVDCQSIEKFATKIINLNSNSCNVQIVGTVKAILMKNTFPRGGDADGVILRLAFRDESGEVKMIAWNEKVAEMERLLKDNSKIVLVNAKVKASQNGELEVHVDSSTFVGTLK
jgi:replication factor A1